MNDCRVSRLPESPNRRMSCGRPRTHSPNVCLAERCTTPEESVPRNASMVKSMSAKCLCTIAHAQRKTMRLVTQPVGW
jgi:hypothetical protein